MSILLCKNLCRSLNSGSRDRKVLYNIIFSFFIKGLSFILSLILVPLTLNYLTDYEYGVWLTVSSILMWLDYFDIGLGSGLRNKLSEALVKNDMKLAKIYVSTTFFSLIGIVSGVILLFVLSWRFIDFQDLLNISPQLADKVSYISIYILFFICTAFVLKTITYIYFAKQLPVINNVINLLTQLLSLLSIWLLMHIKPEGSFEWVACIYSASPMVILLMFYPITFLMYKELIPSLSCFKYNYINQLLTIGLKFFLIQLSCIILYTTSNLIISKVLNPLDVTPFNIAFKYFNCLFFVSSIIFSPMWNAVNEAYARNDIAWIKKAMKKLNVIYIVLFFGATLMAVMSNFMYRLWIGDAIEIPLSLSILIAAYFLVLVYSSLYSNFLNGMNKLNLQLLVVVIASILFIPLAYFLLNLMGIAGMALALLLVNLPAAILNALQYRRIISGQAVGIWNK